MSTRKQIAIFFSTIVLFALYNFALYEIFTKRLGNNFSKADKIHMVDVASYLPFEESSNLPDVNASITLEGDLPVLDGAAALVPVYAGVIHNIYPEGTVTYEGGEFSDDNYYGENFAPDSVMQYQNTVRGYKAIVDGTTDILFCAGPSEEQSAYALEKGVELVYIPIGLEAFVFFVNENNSVDSLTVDQIRGIYDGTYTNWEEVGGPGRLIYPLTRLEGSGSQSMFNRVMDGRSIARVSPLQAVTGASIGFSFRFYLQEMVANSNIKTIGVNGVMPTPENIRNHSYPIVTEFYAIYRADNENPNIDTIIDWLLSPEGQQLIEETGYIAK